VAGAEGGFADLQGAFELGAPLHLVHKVLTSTNVSACENVV
jgi:hypothetical protein